jgi:hypothetical protein
MRLHYNLPQKSVPTSLEQLPRSTLLVHMYKPVDRETMLMGP